MTDEKDITIKDLYPDLTAEERVQAEQNLKDYVCVVKQIYDRLKSEGKWEQTKLRIEYEKRHRNKKDSDPSAS